MKKIKVLLILILPVLVLSLSGCYYDNEEDLYVGSTTCDTTGVSYSQDIAPIFADNCNICHSGNSPTGILYTDSYANVVENITRIKGAVNYETGYRKMPDNMDKLPDCELSKINAWINQGMPQN